MRRGLETLLKLAEENAEPAGLVIYGAVLALAGLVTVAGVPWSTVVMVSRATTECVAGTVAVGLVYCVSGVSVGLLLSVTGVRLVLSSLNRRR